jgi:DHA3 family macrolide efflux protein-like MFS transporter
MENTKRPTGMFGFTIVWLGQIVSVLASSMSQFGLSIWMYDQTKSALAMGVMQVFFITPFLLISPIAGVMVDRHNRKLMMMVSDLAAGLATVAILALQYFGAIEYWHLYLTSIVYGLGMAFQWPAYSATISVMVPKEQYGRANGMMSLIEAGPGVIAPLLAGALLPILCTHPSTTSYRRRSKGTGKYLERSCVWLPIYFRSSESVRLAIDFFHGKFVCRHCLYCVGSHGARADR